MSDVLALGDRLLSFGANPDTISVTVVMDDDRVLHIGRAVTAKVYDRAIAGTIRGYDVRQHRTSWGDPTSKVEATIEIDLGGV